MFCLCIVFALAFSCPDLAFTVQKQKIDYSRTPGFHPGLPLPFVDDYSRMMTVIFLKEKSEAFKMFKWYKAMVEKQSGKEMKFLRLDRGGEFISDEFTNFCNEHGIKR